jgi:hypothetical protein
MVTEAIAVALIAAFASVVVALVQRVRKENSRDHALVVDLIKMLGRKIDKVDSKVDRHVEWHVEQSDRG